MAALASGGALVLVGFMGAGKTTAARALAGALGVESVDADELLEQRLGMPLARYFDEHGEDAFRAEEESELAGLLAGRDRRVIALGGGSLTLPAVRDALVDHGVVWLDVDVDDAWRRASNGARPLARDRRQFTALHAERRPLYEAVADAYIPAGRCKRALPALVAW